jgi:glycerol-3-phosphate acyltransferase PlsX
MRIAIDAMGGDHAPAVTVEGAVLALARSKEIQVILVGDHSRIEPLLQEAQADRQRISVHHTTGVIEMNELPVEGLRRKPDASVLECARLVKSGKAQGMVTAGNTGAAVAATTLTFGMLPGIKRPGIGIPLPTERGHTLLIDVGANINCKPLHLFQYGIMASTYVREMYGVADPTISLLNIGAEEEKGGNVLKETQVLFRRHPVNFKGNIEGQDVMRGATEIVVCEGFIGNVLLKFGEGCAEVILRAIDAELKKVSDEAGQKGQPWRMALKKIRDWTDYSEYGGAPLLGVNGVCFICHGRSGAKAIANAVSVAADYARRQVNEKIIADYRRVTEQ